MPGRPSRLPITRRSGASDESEAAVVSAYTAVASGFLFPLHERLKSHSSVAWRRRLERTQWLPRDEIRQLQLERLRAFLGDVGRRVPYYRELFARLRFDPAAIGSVHDLRTLPLCGKPQIRAAGDRLRAVDARALSRYNTGGSSGEPLVFYIGRDRKSHDVAAKWRATRWWDVDIGDPEVVVWGSPIEVGAQDRLRALRDRALRSTLLPAFEFSQENLDHFVERIARIRPRMLFGYPSSLARIGEHAQRRGRDLSNVGIKVAFVTSERLYDHQRATIATAFGCKVANG
jgi:phenylacetate-CoA ligase